MSNLTRCEMLLFQEKGPLLLRIHTEENPELILRWLLLRLLIHPEKELSPIQHRRFDCGKDW